MNIGVHVSFPINIFVLLVYTYAGVEKAHKNSTSKKKKPK